MTRDNGELYMRIQVVPVNFFYGNSCMYSDLYHATLPLFLFYPRATLDCQPFFLERRYAEFLGPLFVYVTKTNAFCKLLEITENDQRFPPYISMQYVRLRRTYVVFSFFFFLYATVYNQNVTVTTTFQFYS